MYTNKQKRHFATSVRKLLTGLIMYIYPLKIKNIVLYCIVPSSRRVGENLGTRLHSTSTSTSTILLRKACTALSTTSSAHHHHHHHFYLPCFITVKRYTATFLLDQFLKVTMKQSAL